MNPTLPGRFVVPEVVASHFHFEPGSVVADFGAGTGFYLKSLSAMVGERGKVFACEIQKSLVEKLAEVARVQGLDNVTPVWCDLEEAQGIKIRDHVLDGAILVNTLFQLEDRAAALDEMHRTLKRGGVLHLIDWADSFSGLGPNSQQLLSREAATDLLEEHRFMFDREFPAGEHHYGLVFRTV